MNSISYYYDKEVDVFNPSIVHVMKMCQAFAKNGLDVTLYCNSDADQPDLEKVFQKYGITEKFRIETVHLSAFLKRHGHRFGAYYSAWLKTRKGLKDRFIYGRSAMSLYFLRNRTEYVFEAHVEPDILNRKIEYRVLKHKNCRGLVVISHELKKRYMELFPFLKEKKIVVLHDGADLVKTGEAAPVELQGPRDEIKIGYIGSLFPGKCMETLLPLAQRFPQLNIHVVGGSAEWVQHWSKLAEEKGIQNLIMYGHVDNNRVGAFYQAFDICILPFSKDIYTGRSKRVNIGRWTSPLKLFEAMAYAKPIIVSRLATIEEVLTDHENCVMVRPDDIDDWEEKLKVLCADAQLRQRIGRAAQETLEKEYTWAIRAQKAADMYR